MPEGVVCPRCGGAQFAPVTYTWWGGFLGPKLLRHVKCANCGARFNGKTGKDNTTGIVIYCVAGGVLGLVIVILVIVALSS